MDVAELAAMGPGLRDEPPWVPADNGWIAASCDPVIATATGGSLGFLVTSRIRMSRARRVTNLLAFIQTAGAALTAAQNLGGIWDSNGALIATTADQSTAWTGTGLMTMPLTIATGRSLSLPRGFVIAGLIVNGTTAPAFRRAVAGGNAGVVNAGISDPFYRAGFKASQTSAPATLSGLTSDANPYWLALS